MSRDCRDDSGLTLIELLVAMAITLLIITPLFSSFVLTLGQSARSEQDITNSTDAQSLTAFFPQDVANAETVHSSSSCGGSSALLELRWNDGASHYVAYQATTTTVRGATQHQVTRYECSTPSGAPSDTTVVVRSAASAPVVRCDGAACSGTTTTPRVVTITVQDLGHTDIDDSFSFTLTGTRRVTT